MAFSTGDHCVLDIAGFGRLLEALRRSGFALLGPTVRDGAIVLSEVNGVDDFPRGVGDDQAPGHYRLRTRDDGRLFGWAAPAQPWKNHFLPPRLDLVQIRRKGSSLEVHDATRPATPIAVIGARPCGLAAMGVQDRVLSEGPHPDADYTARRRASFVVAVNCGTPAGNCFCASMNTGPRATGGFDLAATELIEPSHRFLIEVGTAAGAQMLASVNAQPATESDVGAADAVVSAAAQQMGRTVDTQNLPDALLANLEHPRWDDVAERCLGCANCTLVCPTCFCTTVEDTTDLSGDVATRTRTWDSCFAPDFAYVHGGSIRPELRQRYRQWHTHKLASWIQQFGTSGCVGCGRCITWCPVGIDITEELSALTGDRG